MNTRKQKRSISCLCACLAAVVSFHAAIASAQQYPTHPVRFISPYPPGGGNDTLLRIIGDKVGEQMGQRIIVDNRPGANTIVGTEVATRAAPDGYHAVDVRRAGNSGQ